MDTVSAEFFYRKPLREDEPKPAFGLIEPDPDRPDHQSFTKKVSCSYFVPLNLKYGSS